MRQNDVRCRWGVCEGVEGGGGETGRRQGASKQIGKSEVFDRFLQIWARLANEAMIKEKQFRPEKNQNIEPTEKGGEQHNLIKRGEGGGQVDFSPFRTIKCLQNLLGAAGNEREIFHRTIAAIFRWARKKMRELSRSVCLHRR